MRDSTGGRGVVAQVSTTVVAPRPLSVEGPEAAGRVQRVLVAAWCTDMWDVEGPSEGLLVDETGREAMNGGYIKLWRRSIDSEVWANPDLWRTWCCCLMLANHEPRWVQVDRKLRPVKVLPGQFITGRYEFHKAMYPKKRKTNKSPRTVWRWLYTLRDMGNLTIETTKRYSLVTVVNWSTYQSNDDENVQQVSNRCPTDDAQAEGIEKSVQTTDRVVQKTTSMEIDGFHYGRNLTTEMTKIEQDVSIAGSTRYQNSRNQYVQQNVQQVSNRCPTGVHKQEYIKTNTLNWTILAYCKVMF